MNGGLSQHGRIFLVKDRMKVYSIRASLKFDEVFNNSTRTKASDIGRRAYSFLRSFISQSHARKSDVGALATSCKCYEMAF